MRNPNEIRLRFDGKWVNFGLGSVSNYRRRKRMRAIDYLQELISFPSVSSESNVSVSDCVEDWLKGFGFDTERINYVDAAGVTKSNVLAKKGPSKGCGLAWFGHTDVVPVNSWSFPKSGPWQPWLENGRVYGRGSCDMKGPIACMLSAIASLDGSSLAAPLWFAVTADEEIGMPGARTVVERSQMYRDIVSGQTRSIIGEPTGLQVVYAHKGGRSVRATSVGRAAHSSTGLGVNANLALIPFLAEVRRLHEELETSAAWHDARFSPPTPTMNLLIRDANTAMNITSAMSQCTLYFRPMPGQDADGMVDRIRRLAEASGLDFEVMFAGEPLCSDPDGPFIRELLKLSGSERAETVSYGTDGAVFTELRDIAVWGPGSIAQAHTDDEWISVEQLERGTELYRQAIVRWCG